MWSILALGAVERVLHHLIDLDGITRASLNQFQGKVLRVVLDHPQLSVDVCFDEAKIRLEPTPLGQTQKASLFEQRPFDPAYTASQATTTLHVEHVVALLKLLLADELGNIPVQGDYRLLQDLQTILQHTELDLASQLSPWIGPQLAHEMGKLQHIPKHLKQQLDSQFFIAEDFLKEDAGLFAPRWQMDELQHSTRQLQQNLDRVEAKIQRLQHLLQTDSSAR